jgi:hypothetical protein
MAQAHRMLARHRSKAREDAGWCFIGRILRTTSARRAGSGPVRSGRGGLDARSQRPARIHRAGGRRNERRPLLSPRRTSVTRRDLIAPPVHRQCCLPAAGPSSSISAAEPGVSRPGREGRRGLAVQTQSGQVSRRHARRLTAVIAARAALGQRARLWNPLAGKSYAESQRFWASDP